jgi:hypothetical protein
MSNEVYLEFYCDKPAVHPQTGDVLPYTTIDVYLWKDGFRVFEYGVIGLKQYYKPEITQTEAVDIVKAAMSEMGLRLINEEESDRKYLLLVDAL